MSVSIGLVAATYLSSSTTLLLRYANGHCLMAGNVSCETAAPLLQRLELTGNLGLLQWQPVSQMDYERIARSGALEGPSFEVSK